jgi:tRNA threonylcarbamoyladenosine biosynthesis protein TsaB
MMTLALEFSSPRRSMALFTRNTGEANPGVLATISDDGVKSARPIPLIEQLLAKAGVKRELVQAVVVGLGPGSYTGIRSAIALAQGWQLARGVRTCGVSSVGAMTAQAQRQGWFGKLSLVIDAQRQEFYLATYALTPERRELLTPLRLVDLRSLQAAAAEPEHIMAGPEVTKWISSGRSLFPEAASLAELADPCIQSVPAENLEPIYLRKDMFVKAPPPRPPPS